MARIRPEDVTVNPDGGCVGPDWRQYYYKALYPEVAPPLVCWNSASPRVCPSDGLDHNSHVHPSSASRPRLYCDKHWDEHWREEQSWLEHHGGIGQCYAYGPGSRCYDPAHPDRPYAHFHPDALADFHDGRNTALLALAGVLIVLAFVSLVAGGLYYLGY